MIDVKDVTATIQIGKHPDFAEATLASWREAYPDMPIVAAMWDVYAWECQASRYQDYDLERLIHMPGCTSEEVRNAMAFLVRTPWMLILDDDVKCLSKDALPILMEAMMQGPDVDITGAYGAFIRGKEMIVGKDFCEHVAVDFMPGYCTLQATSRFIEARGWPHRFVSSAVPVEWQRHAEERRFLKGCTGDFTYCLNQYCLTPRVPVPVLHWGRVKWVGEPRTGSKDEAVADWWTANMKVTRVSPFSSAGIETARRDLGWPLL